MGQPTIGQYLGPYQVAELLGRGGMAFVYRAVEVSVGRSVALKLLDDALAKDRVFRDRFQREAHIAASLQHPHIVSIFRVEAGEGADPIPYLVMPYVRGGTLAIFAAARGRLPFDLTITLVEQIATALDYAHTQGVVHRDVKPSNVLLDGDWPLLADFGIAKAWDVARFTIVGTMLGTPAYMAPEQARGEDVEAPADLYALGIITYELLAGHPPFQGSPSVIQEAHRSAVPPPLAADVPSAARAALERMLAKAPADRFPTAAAFVDGLRGAIPSGVPVGPTGSGATVLEQDAALAPAGGGASDGNSAVASGDRKGVIKPTGARLAEPVPEPPKPRSHSAVSRPVAAPTPAQDQLSVPAATLDFATGVLLAAAWAAGAGTGEALFSIGRIGFVLSLGWMFAGLIGSAVTALAVGSRALRWGALVVGLLSCVVVEAAIYALRIATGTIGFPFAAAVAGLLAATVAAVAVTSTDRGGVDRTPRLPLLMFAGGGAALGVLLRWSLFIPVQFWLVLAVASLLWALFRSRKPHTT